MFVIAAARFIDCLSPLGKGDFLMFTGIISDLGECLERSIETINIKVPKRVLDVLEIGSSISVNGICLTVTTLGKSAFSADIMPETWKRTALGTVSAGDKVNLELPLSPQGRFDGHIVQGHVDGIGTVTSIKQSNNSTIFGIRTEPEDLSNYIVEKGSIAVNGISLTVIDSATGYFTVGIIPHTLENTVLQDAVIGTRLNLEVDIVAKYLRKFINEKV